MKPNEFLEFVLASSSNTPSPLFDASKWTESGSKADTNGASQETSEKSDEERLPVQQPIPPGGVSGAGLPALIETLIKLQTQEAEAAREYYPEKARIDLETYRQQAEIAERAGMDKMREKTARDVELQTITAWQNITQAQINRDTTMGLGMMNLAYAAGLPNPNVLKAGASLVGQGRAGFGTPTSTIK